MLSFLDACATICTSAQLRDITPGAITMQCAFTERGNISVRLLLQEKGRIAEWVGLVDRDITDQDDPEAALTEIISDLAKKLASIPPLKIFGQDIE